jgi:predicted nuclease of restriction endonuclease-like (RecB) superfamily
MNAINKNYSAILESLKEKIRITRQQAILNLNNELLTVYWQIGAAVFQQQGEEGWGAKIIQRLSVDLKIEFPEMKGLSVRNLEYMRAFAEAWPAFVQQPAAQIQSSENQHSIIVYEAAAKLPWGHHQVILDKTKTPDERAFYVMKAVEMGWSRNILIEQIQSELHLRQGRAITNFDSTLPKRQSDLAKETLKNPYIMDFIGFKEEMQERELEKVLIQHIKKFMLELGRGFAFVGNQFNLNVKGDDYFLDLLFFNYHLNCFVIIELKVGKFKPEHAGKMNFYINSIDEQIKGPNHEPTIGILLCRTPNETVIKYALKNINSPLGVADYELTNALPKQLKGDMPSIEEFEHELEREINAMFKPLDEKKARLKDILSKLKGEEIKKSKEAKDVLYLFENVLLPVREKLFELLQTELELFAKKSIELQMNQFSSSAFSSVDIESKLNNNENIHALGLRLHLNGFKPAGTKAFNISSEFEIELREYKYELKIDRIKSIWPEQLYHYKWSETEIQQLTEKWSEEIMDAITRSLEYIV